MLYVVNANLVGGSPAGPGSISWRSLGGPFVIFGTIMLTGADPEFATVGGDSLIYVVSRGTAGAADGRLSIVDPATNREAVVVNGLGELPGPPVFHPSGRLLIASEQEGILEVNTLTRSVRSEEHTSELQSPCNLVCRLLLEKKKKRKCHRYLWKHPHFSPRARDLSI